jgi:outer membrane receptor protein involved in Fe transport
MIALAGMVRDSANDLDSNRQSTPLLVFQHNSFREECFKATGSLNRGRHDLKAGIEADSISLHERFDYRITNPSYFDPGTPPTFTFADQRPDLEQGAFVEDLFRAGNWTVRAGLRWDHYQLVVNKNAFSPRLSVGRYVPSWNAGLHASFDRIFQTPSFENILIQFTAD